MVSCAMNVDTLVDRSIGAYRAACSRQGIAIVGAQEAEMAVERVRAVVMEVLTALQEQAAHRPASVPPAVREELRTIDEVLAAAPITSAVCEARNRLRSLLEQSR